MVLKATKESPLMAWRIVVASVCFLLCGCVSTTTTKLPTFDAALAAAEREQPKKPRLFDAGQLSDRAIQETVPYALLARQLQGQTPQGRAVYLWQHCLALMPDAVVYEDGQASTNVSPGGPVYFGTAFIYSSTSYSGMAVALRDAPACLPFVYRRETLMVVEAAESARAVGILEGDTVAAIDAIPLSLKESPWASPLHLKRMSWRAGTSVRVGLIRPGRGKFDVDVTLLPNERRYLEEADHYDLAKVKDPVVDLNSKRSIVGWKLPAPENTRY